MGKKTNKKTGKGKGATAAQQARIVKRVASDNEVKSVTRTSVAALVSVGACKTVKTVATANQLALALGLDNGKRVRGWLRQADVLGNDGRYSHYGIDVSGKDGKTLVRRACERFRVDFDATMTRLVAALAS